MNFGNFFLLLFSFCSFIVGFFVWFKRSDRLGTAYLFYSLLMTVWGSLLSFTLSDDITYEPALMLARISNAAAVFIAPAWYHFSILFCKFKRKVYSRLVIAFYVLSAAMAITAPTNLLVAGLKPISGFKFYPVPGPSYVVFFISFFVIVFLSFMTLYKRIKETEGKERKRTVGMFAAAAFGYLGGGLSFLPVFGIEVPMYNFAIMSLYPFLLAYFMTREQLFDAEEFATVAHKEKLATIGTLAASVNHEIRNPLYVIKSQGEAFVEKAKEGFYQGEEGLEKSREIIEKSIIQSARAMDIMKRFSTFAKPSGEELNQTNVRLKNTIDNVLQLVSYEVATEEIEIKVNVDEKIEIFFDPRHLEQILFNLIHNACQEIGRSGKIVIAAKTNVISTERFASRKTRMERSLDLVRQAHRPERSRRGARDDEACNLSSSGLTRGSREIDSQLQHSGMTNSGKTQLTITDNGPGIPKDRLNQVFEPFYSTKEEGSGLGLYVTKQLVDQNSGKISVDSKLGQGTTFQIIFSEG